MIILLHSTYFIGLYFILDQMIKHIRKTNTTDKWQDNTIYNPAEPHIVRDNGVVINDEPAEEPR